MKKYETAKIEFISLRTKEDILVSSLTGPIIYDDGAIDGEMDLVDDGTNV
ncbi:MAG: hypothetical protein IJX94_05460 [Clostridia bacterium]|nr:hypothetical protein [Clostridia bacterium]